MRNGSLRGRIARHSILPSSVLLVVLAHAGVETANSTRLPLPLDVIGAGESTTNLVVATVAIWAVVTVRFVITHCQLCPGNVPGAAATPTVRHLSTGQ